MRRISISKNEGVADVVEEIIGTDEEEITIIIPKGSSLAESENNFRLIKREADSAGKSVFVESVDEAALSFAQSSGLRAVHSLFGKERSTEAFMDIIPGGLSPRRSGLQPREGGRSGVSGRGRKKKIETESHHEDDGEPVKLRVVSDEDDDVPDNGDEVAAGADSFEVKRKASRLRIPRFSISFLRRKMAAVFVLFLFLAVGVWLLSYPFARVTVTLDFEDTPWSYDAAMVADSSVSGTNVKGGIIPAELFTMEKNMTHLFMASGKDTVEKKAEGTIWIYNAYSSSPQVLVATTRFEAPDGKIFRIVNQVTVPGAEIKDGKITPSSIAVDVVADKAGEEYNVGPTARLNVPGFRGTPRFEGFYGEIKNSVSGGFIGERPVPTGSDIDEARSRVAELLTGALRTSFAASAPDDFKILDEAIKTEIEKITVNSETNKEGKFSVFGEAEMRALGFRESDITALLSVLAEESKPNSDFKELKISYSGIKPDFDGGNISFSMHAESVLWPEFSVDEFKNEIMGKKISDARSRVSVLERLVGAKISVWPIWMRSMPNNANKIKIVVN